MDSGTRRWCFAGINPHDDLTDPQALANCVIVRGIDDLWDDVKHIEQPWAHDHVPTSPKGRHCASCGTELSIYNANCECHACRAREYDPR